jgi:hypothetical protein
MRRQVERYGKLAEKNELKESTRAMLRDAVHELQIAAADIATAQSTPPDVVQLNTKDFVEQNAVLPSADDPREIGSALGAEGLLLRRDARLRLRACSSCWHSCVTRPRPCVAKQLGPISRRIRLLHFAKKPAIRVATVTAGTRC